MQQLQSLMQIVLPNKQRVVSVGISETSYAQVVDLCATWSRQRQTLTNAPSHYICVTSVHGVILARDDAELALALNAADIATPDGMPIVWALRSLGSAPQSRVYGPTLMLDLCRNALHEQQRIFLYGASPETLDQLQRSLHERFPGIQIAGAHSPPFRPLTKREDEDTQQMIRQANPDLIFVGISTPQQEKWMYAHRASFPGVTMIGVGAAFDFLSGRTRQAPAWMQRHGLEWLFRLLIEPARLWRRYLLVTPRFIPLFACQRLRASFKLGTGT